MVKRSMEEREILRYTVHNEMLRNPRTFSLLTHQEGPRELRSELINFDDEPGLWWSMEK